MKFILIHGAFGSPEGNWFPELKSKLESLGQTVIAPQFPVESETSLAKKGPQAKIEEMTLANWLKTFEKEVIPKIKKGEKICCIGHSLGCVFILRAIDKFKIKLDSAVFVGPFLDCLPTEVWPYTKIIPDFGRTDFEFEDLKKLLGDSYVIFSDNDPYVPNRQSRLFGKMLDSSMIKLRKAGHMNSEVDLDEFSLVLDLCLSRLDLAYTQKYRVLKQRIGAFEYIYSKKEAGEIFLSPKRGSESFFDFRNIQESGFATVFTGLSNFWNPHSLYMENSRKAAGRMREFIRVLVLDKAVDLYQPSWQDQIKSDLASGIKIYACLYEQIREKVPEPDFGIWDNRYIVIVKYDWKRKKADKVVINSNKRTIDEAKKWQQEIMKFAIPIKKIGDIKNFESKYRGQDL